MNNSRARMAVGFLLQHGADSEHSVHAHVHVDDHVEHSHSSSETLCLPPKHLDVVRRPYPSHSNCSIMQLANVAASVSPVHDHIPFSPVSSSSVASSVEEHIGRYDHSTTSPPHPVPVSGSHMSSHPMQHPRPPVVHTAPQAYYPTPQVDDQMAAPGSVAHAAARAPSQGRSNVCQVCGEVFNLKVRFLHHLLESHGMPSYEGRPILPCSKCPFAFLRNTDRSKHDACVHERLRPFRCDAANCSSSFFFAKDLTKHRSTVHLKNKPYSCTICFKAFGKREHMTSHVKRVHEKLRPFRCDVCDIRLASKYNLQGHLKTNAHAAAESLAKRDGRSR